MVYALARETLDGVEYWFASSAPPPPNASPRVHLLQAYRKYLVAYSESKYVLDVSGAARSQPPRQGVFNHVLVLDGQVTGRWRGTRKTHAVVIEVAPYARWAPRRPGCYRPPRRGTGAFSHLPATVVTTG
jgi:hypothetical protein